jgi:spore germination protein (amino acid permease)
MIKEESITGRQLFAIVVMVQLGTEVLSLPHVEADVAGQDTWIAVLLSGLFAQLGILLIWWLGSRYPDRNLYTYISTIVGKPIGLCMNAVFGLYYAFSGFLLTTNYADVLKRWMFVLSPWWILLLMLLIVCGYAATSTLRSLALISQTMIIVPIVGFLLITLSGTYGFDAKNLLPVLSGGWNPVMKGAYAAFSSYVGYDLLLYAYPYVRSRSNKGLLLWMSIANAIAIVFYVAVCLVCSTMFSLRQLTYIPEPIVFILKNYQLEIIQSLDILFLIFYACVVLSTIYVYFFLSSKAFMHLRKNGWGKQSVWVWAIVCACFAGGFFMTKRSNIIQVAALQDQASVYLIVVLPVILLVLSTLQRTMRNGV